jgi:hypothetical protein
MPRPPGWQLGGPFVGADDPLAEVDTFEPEALEPEALEPEALEPLEPEALEPLEPKALEPEALVAEEMIVVAASAPELIEAEPVEAAAVTSWPAPPSHSDAALPASGSVLAPQPSWMQMTTVAAVTARMRVWDPAALIALPNTIAVGGRRSQERARGSARAERRVLESAHRTHGR